MKRDRLEQFIAENRDQFDLYDPGDRVWKDISSRMQKSRRLPRIKTILWRAAAVIIIFAASFLVQEYLQRHNILIGDREKRIQSVDIPELYEAEIYYARLVDDKIKEIEPLLKDHPGLDNELKNDLAELDSIYAALQQDLIDNIANDEVIEAMIQNYRLKLDILEDLLEYLQETSKSEEDENSEYEI
ncbi:MAG: hypothetical protein AMS27_09585 [Bacteroides sp. SM23_62_1]|nr:MAG: hypothetical protein AMS27_09585 [Bacteroides sp. SM23_62_1]